MTLSNRTPSSEESPGSLSNNTALPTPNLLSTHDFRRPQQSPHIYEIEAPIFNSEPKNAFYTCLSRITEAVTDPLVQAIVLRPPALADVSLMDPSEIFPVPEVCNELLEATSWMHAEKPELLKDIYGKMWEDCNITGSARVFLDTLHLLHTAALIQLSITPNQQLYVTRFSGPNQFHEEVRSDPVTWITLILPKRHGGLRLLTPDASLEHVSSGSIIAVRGSKAKSQGHPVAHYRLINTAPILVIAPLKTPQIPPV